MLDTNIISELVKSSPDPVVVKKVADNAHFCAVSSIAWQEMLTGVKLLPDGKKRTILEDFYYNFVAESFPIVEYTASDAVIASDYFAQAIKGGNPLPYADVQIAANARNHNMILVTRNVNDYRYLIENCNLSVENWFENY